MDQQAPLPSSVNATVERAARQREVDNALLVQQLFGRRPSLVVRTKLLRYIAGEVSREQAFADLYSGL